MGAPRTVHQMASVILASLMGRGNEKIPAPSLVKTYDKSVMSEAGFEGELPDNGAPQPIIPNKIILPAGRPLLQAFLSAPLCNLAGGKPEGTLKSLSDWCAGRKHNVKLHFAKTGTQVTMDPDATVDAWVAGGLQFTSGQAYSYVAVVGTGDSSKPWARKLHAAQVTAPLIQILLEDLAGEAKPLVAKPVTGSTDSAVIAANDVPGKKRGK
jgi:penicillin-binding protein 1A